MEPLRQLAPNPLPLFGHRAIEHIPTFVAQSLREVLRRQIREEVVLHQFREPAKRVAPVYASLGPVDHVLDVPKTGRAGSLRLCVVRPAVVGHEHLDVRVIAVDLAEAVQVPHEVVLVQEIPSRKWGAGKTPIIVSRIAEFPVVFHINREEAVECHR